MTAVAAAGTAQPSHQGQRPRTTTEMAGGGTYSLCSRAATPRMMRAPARLSNSIVGKLRLPTFCRGRRQERSAGQSDAVWQIESDTVWHLCSPAVHEQLANVSRPCKPPPSTPTATHSP